MVACLVLTLQDHTLTDKYRVGYNPQDEVAIWGTKTVAMINSSHYGKHNVCHCATSILTFKCE